MAPPAAADRFSLAGQVALVTGATRGLGAAIASGLACAGAHVVLGARDQAALEAAQHSYMEAGRQASICPFDVRDEAAVITALAAIVRAHGKLDILVNNAGLSRRAPIAEHTTADWQYVLDVNLSASFYLAREAAKPMLAHRFGRIINIASIAALIARPGGVSYYAAKHGVAGLTKALAAELGGRGVTANAIAPGFFSTESTAPVRADPAREAWVRGRTPANRWGEPHEVAGAAIFLASRASSYVNGHMLVVDGGFSASM